MHMLSINGHMVIMYKYITSSHAYRLNLMPLLVAHTCLPLSVTWPSAHRCLSFSFTIVPVTWSTRHFAWNNTHVSCKICWNGIKPHHGVWLPRGKNNVGRLSQTSCERLSTYTLTLGLCNSHNTGWWGSESKKAWKLICAKIRPVSYMCMYSNIAIHSNCLNS